MKILVIGSGAREDAIARRLSREGNVVWTNSKNHFAYEFGNVFYADIPTCCVDHIVDFCKIAKFKPIFDLIVVGPEAPLAEGLVDRLEQFGSKVIGPKQLSAKLESSKIFAKQMMSTYDIPTAPARAFSAYDGQAKEAKDYLRSISRPVVIKADGLAGGKGVFLEDDREKAIHIIDELMEGKLGSSGRKLLIEDRLEGGYELSFTLCIDGSGYKPMIVCQDHKRLLDGNLGPNTGGMGVVAPALHEGSELYAKIIEKVVDPTMKMLKEEGLGYRGFLFIGLMIVKDEPYVLEYNVRLGDPEAQVIVSSIESSFTELLMAMSNGSLSGTRVSVSSDFFINVVMASSEYPESSPRAEIGEVSTLIDVMRTASVYSGGVEIDDGKLIQSGGRLMSVVSHGKDIALTKNRAYDMVKKLKWVWCRYRRDIGEYLRVS